MSLNDCQEMGPVAYQLAVVAIDIVAAELAKPEATELTAAISARETTLTLDRAAVEQAIAVCF